MNPTTLSNPLIQKALEIAHSRIGVREIGHSNTGAEVDSYLARVGDAPGNPWCAAFEYTCVDDAAIALSVRNPLLRSGYCPDIGNWARTHNILFSYDSPQTPQAGDLFLEVIGGDFHHTGIVSAYPSPNSSGTDADTFQAIAGNTNSDGSREGYAVLLQDHTLSDRFSFVRWINLADSVSPPRSLFLGDTKVFNMPVLKGISYVPARQFCDWVEAYFSIGLKLDWDASKEPPIFINGTQLPAQVSLIENKAYVPLRALVNSAGHLKVDYNSDNNSVTLTKVPS